ncbi:MAG: phospholipid methyltransferase [Desulfobulbus propionicus]|nr:MAG: phospholipid methyltransferase [Desulfobulbus propionicus]
MELFPKISIDLLGGWTLTAIYLSINIGLPLTKAGTLKKLLTSSKKHSTFIEKLPYMICQFSWFFTIFLPIILPIKINSNVFIIGIIAFITGIILTLISLHNYITTPLNEQVKKGIYKFSRNPIYASYNIFGFSIALLTGSWTIFILHIIEIITCHLKILDEEKYCINKYGNEYKVYMKKVPRYYFWKI